MPGLEPTLKKRGGSSPDRPRPLASFHHDPPKVSASRFLDFQGPTGRDRHRRPETPALAEPRTEAAQNEASVKAFEAFAYRLDLTGPLPAHQTLIAIEELKRRNVPDGAPVGVLVATVSRADGRVFLGCGGPDTKREYNVVHSDDPSTGQRPARTYLGHTDPILDMVVSPDGQRLATASVNNTARVWTIPGDSPKSLHSGATPATSPW